MEFEEGPVNDLVALGLARYEARVYLALVRRESYTAAEVAREADVPRQRVYDVLDALVRRRLAVARPGRVATFSAIAPELAIARLMALQRESLERLDRVSAGLASALLPIWTDGRTHTDPLDYIEVLRDPKVIAERFADIQEQAGHELLSFCKPPFVAPAANTEGIKVVRRLRKAGGTVRAIYTHDALGDAEVLENVRRFGEAGEEARFAAELPMKLIIADASLVLCDMPDPVAGTGSTTALFIEHPALAGCLRLAFLTVWGSAETRPMDPPS
ncbi:TrmB family transcriptional regulator [Streptomyces sp. SID13666]|uniref:TrmB family transcriptional regulator n=1 Tax=Streptomyces TaxID=1883 RepID=UPI001106D6EB|nr:MULTISPECIES: helix-turn-helix domain-containing protein [Streptomyces]MCZ4101679.1 TrmB family transcriptional regulator [Streptomyces sp. H39-C1]NEA58200.1 TrmB family transcriptional regulator [Streptomyces sp. SID13666]NEA73899.1 TrmB family transcriptional regulator [Streptomyces sp. SID13588]QNA76152.1 TrmB family transcriptional regulator [Streptomyces sp. So13.3]